MTEQTPATATETPTDAAALAALTQTEPVEPVVTEPAPEPVAPRITIPDSVISEMTGLRSRARDAETELAKARREAADARALAERLQRGDGKTDPPAAPTQPAPSQDQYQADVNRAAEMQRVMEDTVAVKNAGIVKFPDFQQSLNTLTALGVTSNLDIVMDILAAAGRDNAHVMLDRLAKDPEKAASIAQMTPRARIAELTRMTTVTAAAPATTTKPAAPPAPVAPAKTVSRAPAPAPVVEPSASKPAPHWLSDDNSDDQVTAGFNEMLKKRAAVR